MRFSERFLVAIASFIATWLFFIEYIPPTKKVHFWSDIEGFHYPLLAYVYRSLRDGRFPLWDPTIYSGVSLAGNIQAALFYPPNWILYIFNAHRPTLPYTAVEILAIAHVWLAFLLAYLWLRDRSHHWFPAVIGAGVTAYCGYVLSQFNHLGVINAYAWMPLGLWGIDQAARTQSWRPLWKVAVASAMCLLAGYPPAWVAFAIVAVVYAITLPGRSRLVPLSVFALAFGLVLGAVQLLPAIEAAKLKTPERYYGGPLPDEPRIYLSFLLPNYYDQNRIGRGPDINDGDYLYLGVPALFAFFYVMRRPRLPGTVTAFVVAGICLLIISNPRAKLEQVVNALPLVPDVLRSYNVLVGLMLSAALLSATAVDHYLKAPLPNDLGSTKELLFTRRWRHAWTVVTVGWTVYLVCLWPRGNPDFLTGLSSVLYPSVLLFLMTAGLALYRRTQSSVVAAVLLLALFVDYKAFGTNRRFSAVTHMEDFWAGEVRAGGRSLRGLDDQVYEYLLKHPTYRLAIVEGPYPTDLRFYALTTPQGFDPFVSQQYKDTVEAFVKFRTNRVFDIDAENELFLQHFGVRFVMLRNGSETAHALSRHPRFRRLEPSDTFFQVYEYRNALPAWRFVGATEVVAWTPERRSFRVTALSNGRFTLLEQFWPGWNAYADGQPLTIERCLGTFQCATIPAGAHDVEFVYQPGSVFTGGAISLFGCAALAMALRANRRTIQTVVRSRTETPPSKG